MSSDSAAVTDEPLPKLHRTWLGDWSVEGHLLVLSRDGSRLWSVNGINNAARRWVLDHGLQSAQFATCREALRTVMAVNAVTPAPADRESLAVKLTRGADGNYRDDRRQWRLTRGEPGTDSEGFWSVFDRDDVEQTTTASLWEARVWIAEQRGARADDSVFAEIPDEWYDEVLTAASR